MHRVHEKLAPGCRPRLLGLMCLPAVEKKRLPQLGKKTLNVKLMRLL